MNQKHTTKDKQLRAVAKAKLRAQQRKRLAELFKEQGGSDG